MPAAVVPADLTNWLWALAFTYFKPALTDGDAAEWTTEDDPACPFTGSDDERIAMLRRTRSFAARLSSKKVTFEDLWTANVDKLSVAYPPQPGSKSGLPYDASSADQALFNHVAYAFGNNCDAIERVLLEHPDCALRREKWNRADYRHATILKAAAIPKRWPAARRTGQSAIPPAPTVQPAPVEAHREPPAMVVSGLVPAPPVTSVPPPPGTLPADLPAALYDCTDQANAGRLQTEYGSNLISVAGDFYAWDSKRWRLDDGAAQRYACDLSRMVSLERNEAAREFREMQARVNEGVGEDLIRLEDKIEALTKWAAKCEMRSTQEAALSMLRKLLNVPVEKIDAHPWFLNVENGTIDLRDGELMLHNPAHLITKLAPSRYDPAATAPRFRQFLAEIFPDGAGVVEFIQRWYGYATTGDAREQKLLIKHGPGGNGKSTLSDAIDGVLGEYSSPATLGLLTGKAGASDTAHLAEIADLRGRRLVSASESEDGAKLKEALLKQLTGGDTLKGKRLYGQLFSFKPTHKLELLTNHKPVIKGSDFSI